jgi:hypothetical protein
VLARVGRDLFRSRVIGWHQKLDVIAELAVPGPAIQAGVCVALGAALLATQAPLAGALAAALGVTLLRPASYAVIGLCLDPEPVRAAAAFAFLPVYAVWRCAMVVRSLALLRGGPWVRTAR